MPVPLFDVRANDHLRRSKRDCQAQQNHHRYNTSNSLAAAVTTDPFLDNDEHIRLRILFLHRQFQDHDLAYYGGGDRWHERRKAAQASLDPYIFKKQ